MRYNEMMHAAKTAVAGIKLMTEIIDKINARRPDLVEDATEKTLGIKHEATDAVFNTTMNKRAGYVKTFDAYEDRVAELEAALREVKEMARLNVAGPAAVRICDEVLNNGTR